MLMQAKPSKTETTGEIIAIRGGVLDIHFTGKVPRIHDLLRVGTASIEVSDLVGEGIVRGIALSPIQGLGLGMTVEATGGPIMVPVGDAVRGRMLNVFGQPIDGKEPLDTAAQFQSTGALRP